MGYDGSIKFDTKLDEKGFKKGVKGLEGIAKKSLGGINKIFKATGVAVAGIGAIAIKSGAEFEKSMNRVGALANATDAEMEKLTKTARQLGKDTVFSAQEASEGMQNLAMAGFKVNEITEAMPGLLDLAAAGQTDLATTSDITASMLRGFQLEASESGRVADVMAKGFTNSNTSLETLGESMKYVAPVASSLGFSIEETTAAIGKLGDAGIKGTQSGTALRAIMLRLVDPPKQAAEEMKRLGISVTDAQGNMEDFPDIIKSMELATKDMTEAEKAATLSKIAGTNASSALMALVNEGGDSLAAFTKELDNAGGTAQEIAERQLKGLIGQFELLKSELSEVGLKIYDGLDMPLGALLGTFREYVGELDRVIAATQSFRDILSSDSGPDAKALALDTSDIPDPAQYLAQGIANVVTDMIVALTESLPQVIETGGQFVAYFLQGIQEKVPELSESLSSIITSMLENYITLVPQMMGLGAELITGVTAGLVESTPNLVDSFLGAMHGLMDTAIENIPIFIEAGASIIKSIGEGLGEGYPEYMNKGIEIILTLVESIIENLPLLIEGGLHIIEGLGEGIVENMPILVEAIPEVIQGLVDIIQEYLPEIIELGIEIVLALVDGIVESLPVLIEAIPDIVEQVADIFMENLPAILEAGGEIILALIDGITDILPELITVAIEIIDELASSFIENLPEIIDTGIELILALADGLIEAIPQLIEKIPEIIEQIVIAILDNLPKIITSGIEIIIALAKGLIKAIPRLIAIIPKIVIAIVKALLKHDWIGTGKKILGSVRDGIVGMANKLGEAASKAANKAIDKIKETFNKGKEKGRELIDNIVNGISEFFSNLISKASEIGSEVIAEIKEGFSSAVDIGRNLVEGIWNGISGATGWLMGKVKGFASDVVSGVKGFFGIHSPSRVFRDEIGTQLVRGIIVGIQDETPALRQASEKEMMKLVDDYALYGRKAAKAYGKLSHQELKELQKQHKDDGKALAEAIAKGVEEKTDSVVAALEKLREQSIRELDKLGEATIKALKAQYKEEEDLAIANIDKRLEKERQASQERISVYEEEARKKIALLDEEQSEIVSMLQAQVDAINAELDAEKEAEEEREYQKKLAEAKERVRVAKTNRERQKAQEEVEELITQKKRKEFEKRKKQEIKDLQDAMKAVENNAKDKIAALEKDITNHKKHEEEKLKEIEKGLEEERETIKSHYAILNREEQLQAEARKLILAENNDELIELLDSYNPYWMDAGQSFGESLLDGLNSMKYEIEDVVNDMLSMVATAEMANAKIIQAKLDYEAARLAGDKAGMANAHKQAEKYRKQGGTIGADIGLNTKNYERELNQRSQDTRAINPYKNGVVQNIKIVSPENTPSENARQMKRKGEELILDY